MCLSEDLKDLPKRVRILGEDLIAFRDGQRERRGYCSFAAVSGEHRLNTEAP